MPEFTSHDDFKHAVDKSFWALTKDEACTFFNNESFPLNTVSYRWNIEQAIANRKSGTMLEAGLSYIQKLTEKL